MRTVRVNIGIQANRDVRVKVRTLKLAYKNLWFKRGKFAVTCFALLVHFFMYLVLQMLYQKTQLVTSIVGTCATLSFFWFVIPALILRIDYKRNPDYIIRLAGTIPEYYDNVSFLLKNTDP